MTKNEIGVAMDADRSWCLNLGKECGTSFEQLFKAARTRSGKSARGLSIECGLSPAYVSKVESGDTKPSIQAFAKLVQAMGCSDIEILFMMGTLL